MHSYLKTVGFSQITRRSEIKEIIRDVIASYDEKVCVENHPEGVFVQFSKNYGCDCGISVCGQYDENGEFHVEYYFPFFRGTGITSKEKVTVERHTDKESAAVFRHAPAVCSGSLSDGDPGEHAGEIPVHTFGSGRCLFRK